MVHFHKCFFIVFMLCLSSAAFGFARTELVTVDLTRRTSPVNWTWTADADSAVRVTVKSDGSDFDLREWGAYLFVGDANLATDIPGSNASLNQLTFDVTRQYLPTNGKYVVQIIATNATGRVEEWARGNVTVRANPAIEAMPATWNGYVDLAARIAPLITRQLVIEEVAATTTVMKAELKGYIDGQIESAGSVTATAVTNAANAAITNHVASGYLCTKQWAEGVAESFYSNAVNDAGSNVPDIVTMQYVKDLGFLGGFYDYTSGTKTYRRSSGNIYLDGSSVIVSNGDVPEVETTLGALVNSHLTTINNEPIDGRRIIISTYSIGAVPTYRKVNGKPLTGDITIESMPDNGLVLTNDAVKTKSGTAITAGHVGAASAAEVNQMGQTLNAVSAHLNAEDARFVSTNQYGVGQIPEAYVEIKINDNWQTIWKEMTRWGKFVGNAFNWNTWQGFHAWYTNVTAQLETKAERCWGIYDSETGEISPDGYTQISSSNILIAANMSYKRVVDTANAIWVLESNSGLATLGGTNGYFRVKDGDGNTQFEIIKGNLRELGCDAGGITVNNSGATPVLTIPYSVVAASHPTLKICTDLTTADWKAESEATCAATVSWSGSSGAYVATVTAKSNSSAMFVKATYMGGSETIINNIAPTKMQYIYIGNTKYAVGYTTISGTGVMTLTPQ